MLIHSLKSFIESSEWKKYLENTIDAEKTMIQSMLKNFKAYKIEHPGLMTLYQKFLQVSIKPSYNPCIEPDEIRSLLPFIELHNPAQFKELLDVIEQQHLFLTLLNEHPELRELQTIFESKILPKEPNKDYLKAIKLISSFYKN